MPIQNSPPARQTRSQARTEGFLTPTPRAPLDGTPEVPQLRAQLGPGEDGEEEEENAVEEEGSYGTEGVPAPVGPSQGIGGPTLSQSEPSLLAIRQQMTQIMANLQASSSSESSRPPAFKTLSIKAPECFDGTQPFKAKRFIQSCQLRFHNYLENFSQ
ncbi:hypothetical protein O181_051851 [Austropuccinia psidii MF-1]|uniref:Uncharacterized protein n=1 Tax=Austropuccinia psidii MF-1 TaxID=1389203 RepID=A0A9Q3E4H8_9BASI|nr:hypothetical protein [Austropuccinia psidii MF-1]